MENCKINVLEITKAAIYDKIPEVVLPVEWEDLYERLNKGKLGGISIAAISRMAEENLPPDDIWKKWQTYGFQRGLRQMASVNELKNILQNAEQNELHPILFKGIVLADLYPAPYMRYSCDADVYICPEEREKMENILSNAGFSKNEGASKQHVPVYENGALKIELHDRLWEDYEGLQAKILDSLELIGVSKRVQIQACGFKVWTMQHEEHLIYQIFHMAKHFSVEGLPLRYITDMTLFINRYYREINWEHFWVAMKKLKYETFAAALFHIGQEHLSLTSQICIPSDVVIRDKEILLEDVLSYGMQKDDVTESFAATEMIAAYMMRENKQTTNVVLRKLSMVFPTPSMLKEKYSYAKRYPVLLPIAWIHRYISVINYSIICRRKGFSSAQVVDKANYRIQLMTSLGLADEQ